MTDLTREQIEIIERGPYRITAVFNDETRVIEGVHPPESEMPWRKDALIADLIAAHPQIDGKTSPVYYMELAGCFGQLIDDLERELTAKRLHLKAQGDKAQQRAEAVEHNLKLADEKIQRMEGACKAAESALKDAKEQIAAFTAKRTDYKSTYVTRFSMEQQIEDATERERERCAKICEKRAETRFEENGTTEHDTGATYYGGETKKITIAPPQSAPLARRTEMGDRVDELWCALLITAPWVIGLLIVSVLP